MRFKQIVDILKEMRRSETFDMWDDDHSRGYREGYNQALADMAVTIQIELKKEKARQPQHEYGENSEGN